MPTQAEHILHQEQMHQVLCECNNGQVTVASGELDFDNPADANRDNKYHFTVHYTDSAGNGISEEIELTITDRAAVTASSTTGSSSLSVTKLKQSHLMLPASGTLSDAFKEFVANDNGLHNYSRLFT